MPPKWRNKYLDRYCNILENQAEYFKPSANAKCNMSKQERLAMKELREMVLARKIRISSADKGGAVVVQNSEDYIKEAKRQLENTTQYEVLANDPTLAICEQSNNIVSSLYRQDIIDENTFKWGIIDPNQVRTHSFYHLPKIHKFRRPGSYREFV